MISKIGVKMNLRIISKNHAADSEIGFLKKSILMPYGRATAIPPAWELRFFFDSRKAANNCVDSLALFLKT